MKITHWLAAAACCLASLPSYAGVIYEWQSIKNESPRDFRLVLEFDEQTVQKGSIDLSISRSGLDQNHVFPDSGLLSLQYWVGSWQVPSIAFFPRTSQSSGPGGDTVQMRLNFGAGGTLSGGIFASNNMHQFTIASQGDIFTVVDVNSDVPNPACPGPGAYQCGGGATGRLVLREVPEPAPLALLAIGFAAALGGQRHRARQ